MNIAANVRKPAVPAPTNVAKWPPESRRNAITVGAAPKMAGSADACMRKGPILLGFDVVSAEQRRSISFCRFDRQSHDATPLTIESGIKYTVIDVDESAMTLRALDFKEGNFEASQYNDKFYRR
jgi:hypothetical protein